MTQAEEPRERLEATVHGHVQGVGFRFHVYRAALSLGISGWVANQGDGTVTLVAQGPKDSLDQLEELIRTGPAAARVERVEARRGTSTDDTDEGRFRIRSGSHAGD